MYENVWPVGYGNEEEVSFKYLKGGLVPRETLKEMLVLYRGDPELAIVSYGKRNEGKLDSTGGALYVDRDHLEIATPEYRSIAGLLARLESHEDIAADVAVRYLKKYPHVLGIGINRRTRDYPGNTFGVHDSLGAHFLEHPDTKTLQENLRPYLTAHFLSRPFMTGAGLVTDKGLYFSQKLAGAKPPTAHAYAFNSSLYRFTSDEGGLRFESRSSDLNILGAWLRIGSTAIALALAGTPWLAREFEPFTRNFMNEKTIHRQARTFNTLDLKDDGTLVVSPSVLEGMKFQLLQAQVCIEELPRFTDVPPEIIAVAKKMKDYSQTAIRVAAGEASIRALAEQNADWAEKFSIILRRIARDRKSGKTRTLLDEASQRDDLAYDFVQVSRDKEQPQNIRVQKVGYGYKVRDRRRELYPDEFPAAKAVANAATPPDDTRAGLRARLIRDYRVIEGSWRALKMLPKEPNGTPVTVRLPRLRTTQLPASEEPKLAFALRRTGPSPQGESPGV